MGQTLSEPVVEKVCSNSRVYGSIPALTWIAIRGSICVCLLAPLILRVIDRSGYVT